MISTQAAYGAALQAQAATQPTTPDSSGAFSQGPLNQAFYPAPTRIPVVPAQSPVMTVPTMPQGTPLSMPSIVGTATTMLPPFQSGLQPSDLLHPLPSIVNTEPTVMTSPCANTIEQWVSDNPMLAVLGLGALAYFVLGGHKR